MEKQTRRADETTSGIAGKKILVAIPVSAFVDPSDSRNCLSGSWEDPRRKGTPGRCPGIGTILDSDDLVCDYFKQEDPKSFSPFDIRAIAVLRDENGKIARWGTKHPVRRCKLCLLTEQKEQKSE